jgi:hypothetical protein
MYNSAEWEVFFAPGLNGPNVITIGGYYDRQDQLDMFGFVVRYSVWAE